MHAVPLSSSQKTEVLRRQAFKCDQCQTDLEPVGSAPPHFAHILAEAVKGASGTMNVRALCPSCQAKSGSEGGKASDEKKRRQRESNRTAKRFIKSGYDMKKF